MYSCSGIVGVNAVLPWALPCIRHHGQSYFTMNFAALNHSLKQTYFIASEPVLRLGSWGCIACFMFLEEI